MLHFTQISSLIPTSLQELLALRKLQRTRQGIDAVKLSKGDIKKKRKPRIEGEEAGTIDLSGFGLQPQRVAAEPDEDQWVSSLPLLLLYNQLQFHLKGP